MCSQIPDPFVLSRITPHPWFRLLDRRLFVSHPPLTFFIQSAILLAADASLWELGLRKPSCDPLPPRLHQNGTLGLPVV